jgi:hypothetical protein
MNKIAAAALAALATLLTNAHAIDQQTFEPLHRAAKAMETAAQSNVSYERFGELAQSLATELLAAKEHAQSDEDRALVMLYTQAGLAYGDSLAFWRQKSSSSSPNVPSGAPSIAPLVVRYAISTEGEDVDADAAMRLIWTVAAKALHKAELLYDGRADELVAIMDAERSAEAETPHAVATEQAPLAQPLESEDAKRTAEAEHQRAMIEQVAEEFARAERQVKRPSPYEVSPGSWTCPRGYVVRRGKCLSDEEIARLPKVEMGN